MRYEKWDVPENAPSIPEEMLSAGYTPLLAAVLCARGLGDVDEARRFIECDAGSLHDPFMLDGMELAVERLSLAIDRRETIAVYGDYDVDGITSGCLVTDYLRSRGLSPVLYIPDRLGEGYGLNKSAIKTLSDQGVTLIITVDCGVTAVEETEYAASLGMDTIITDHHECSDNIPDVVAVVNPKKQCCGYPSRTLAGVGVAFKLICALHGDSEEILERYSDMVAVGTVADVMPLVGENRYLVRRGIEKLRAGPRPGLGALMSEAGINRERINSVSIGFTLAPRINAAGRLGMVNVAVSLLLTNDAAEAEVLAKDLCGFNRLRQELEAKIWREAEEELGPPPGREPIVLAREGWHQGVIGIVASRLAESYCVPAVMISLDGDSGKGSCRSSDEWSLFEALAHCSEYLESYGGHALAAGLTIKRSCVEDFKKEFSKRYKASRCRREKMLHVDLTVSMPQMLTLECAESLELLEPCGQGNQRPQAALLDAVVESVVPLAGGRHVRLYIEKFYQTYECVFFSQSYEDFEFHRGDTIDLAFFPQINEYRGRRSVQLLIADIREAEVYELCRRAMDGTILPEESEGHVPERPDFARLWRNVLSLTDGGKLEGYEADFHVALQKLGVRENYLKTAIGLSVLTELGLLGYEMKGGNLSLMLKNKHEKVQLQDSQILRRLKKESD